MQGWNREIQGNEFANRINRFPAGSRLWRFLLLVACIYKEYSSHNPRLICLRSLLRNLLLIKIFMKRSHVLQLDMKKVFYGTFLFGITTTFIMLFLVLTSDFLARHGLIHILLILAGFILTICAIWVGIKVIFKSDLEKKTTDIILLFFSGLHVLFVGLILLVSIF